MKVSLHKKLWLTVSLVGLLAGAQAPASSAQDREPQSTNGAAPAKKIKVKAPVSKESLQIKLPRAQEATLSNGLQVVLLENRKFPTVSMQMVILSGGLSDPPNRRGLAQSTADLLPQGTTTRTAQQIAEQTEFFGSTINANASTASSASTVAVSGLSYNFDRLLDIFADVVCNPSFPAAEVESFKARSLAERQSEQGDPEFLGRERFLRAVYADHPAALVSPPFETVCALTPAALKEFHQTYYRPNNALLAVAGDVTMKDLLPQLEKAFGSWQKAAVPAAQIPKPAALSKPGVFLIDLPDSVQTALMLGNLSLERTNPDYSAVRVMNQIFGVGPQGRLFRNLRENKGYTYGAYSDLSASNFAGFIMATAEVRTEATEAALKEFIIEIKRIREEKVSPTELENAKRAIIGSFALSLVRPEALLSNIIERKLYNLPVDYYDAYPQEIAKITAADVQRAAQKYLDLPHLQIVAVGDAAKVRSALAAYGTVEQYDAEGKIINAATAATTKKP